MPDMTDFEMIKKCALKMGIEIAEENGRIQAISYFRERRSMPNYDDYDPLTNDAQAMAMVKRFEMQIITGYSNGWIVSVNRGRNDAQNENLNRAIVECVAKLP